MEVQPYKKMLPRGKVSGDEFFDLCTLYPDAPIERDEHGYLVFAEPSGFYSDYHSLRLAVKLSIWNEERNVGVTSGSSAGFILPTGAILSPDAAWISNERWKNVPEDLKEKFAPVCPDFVVEMSSPSDRIKTLREKMHHWITAGARLGWLFDRQNECVYIYTSGGKEEKVRGFDGTLSGGDVLPGFVFDLKLMKKL